MAGDVDHVVDAAEDSKVTVRRLHRAVTRQVRPVAPVLALGITAVARVVLPHVAIRVLPDGLERAGPGVADADIARLARTARKLLPLVVVDHRMDARNPGSCAARLHLVDRRHRAAKESAVFGL